MTEAPVNFFSIGHTLAERPFSAMGDNAQRSPHGVEGTRASPETEDSEIVDDPSDASDSDRDDEPTKKSQETKRGRRLNRRDRRRRMRDAWKAFIESFQSAFSSSDDDVDDSDTPDQGDDDDENGPTPPAPRYKFARHFPTRVSESDSSPSREVTIDTRPTRISRSATILDPSAKPEITYAVQLYQYTEVSRRGTFEEPVLSYSFERSKPPQISRQVTASDDPGPGHSVFRLVSMYSVPSDYPSPWDKRNTPGTRTEDDPLASGDLNILAELGRYMTITSPAVLKALRAVTMNRPDLSRAVDSFTIPEPFCLIVHYRKELEDYRDALPTPLPQPPSDTSPDAEDTGGAPATKPSDDETCRHDLNVLLSFIFSGPFSTKYNHEMALHRQAAPTCTYELSWLLFRPGTVVYARQDKDLSAFIVESVALDGLFAKPGRRRVAEGEVRPRARLRGSTLDYHFSSRPGLIVVRMFYLEFDGDFIGRRSRKIHIRPFDGEKSIDSLPIFPAEYCTDTTIREKLVERGKKYVELTKRSYLEHWGETLSLPRRTVRRTHTEIPSDLL